AAALRIGFVSAACVRGNGTGALQCADGTVFSTGRGGQPPDCSAYHARSIFPLPAEASAPQMAQAPCGIYPQEPIAPSAGGLDHRRLRAWTFSTCIARRLRSARRETCTAVHRQALL